MDTIRSKDMLQKGIAKYHSLLNATRYSRGNAQLKTGRKLPPVPFG